MGATRRLAEALAVLPVEHVGYLAHRVRRHLAWAADYHVHRVEDMIRDCTNDSRGTEPLRPGLSVADLRVTGMPRAGAYSHVIVWACILQALEWSMLPAPDGPMVSY